MHINELNNKAICMLGYGREGQAMVSMVEKFAPDATITVCDSNPECTVQNSDWSVQLGEEWLKDLDRFDVIITSPGIPPHALPEDESIQQKITNSTQIFLDTVTEEGARVIGVTGSKGKSTTSSLIAHVLSNMDDLNFPVWDVHLVGNIGIPSIEYIEKVLPPNPNPNIIFVLEMSSAQLMRLTSSPHIALITSFFPEHLDYHGTIEAYRDAKNQITKFQTADDFFFYASDFDECSAMATNSSAVTIGFTSSDCPFDLSNTKLIGSHNKGNAAGAWKVCEHIGIDFDSFQDALESFEPLPHRLQSLGTHHGIEWIDDAISTTPDSTIAAIDAFGERLSTIILGGKDRGLDFSELGKRIDTSNIRTVILHGESGTRIAKTITNENIKIVEATTMDEVITLAKEILSPTPHSPSPIVLLSPSSPSYDLYKNFEEKGEKFKAAIANC